MSNKLVGVVGRGGIDDPVPGLSTFQSDKLLGLGSTNGGKIMIISDGVALFNFGLAKGFNFDNETGFIKLGTNKWVNGSGLIIDLNQ